MERRLFPFVGTMLLGLALASPALAVPIVFTTLGPSASEGWSQGGEATFEIDSGAQTLTITLEQISGGGLAWDGGIASILDGFSFTYSGGGTITGLTSVTSPGGIDCTDVAQGDPCPLVGLTGAPTNFGWIWTDPSGAALPLGLYAGDGALHPWGILNDDVIVQDGLGNAQHNPNLLGATFVLSFTGAITDITSATFYYGTKGEPRTGELCVEEECFPELPPGDPLSTPEPASMTLLGTGLAALVARRVRRRQ